MLRKTLVLVGGLLGVLLLSSNVANADVADEDPLGLVPNAGIQQLYSTGTDRVGVWVCSDADHTDSWYVEQLERTVSPWYGFHSRGRYTLQFVPKGELDAASGVCIGSAGGPDTDALAAANPDLTGAIFFFTPNLSPAARQAFMCDGSGPGEVVPCEGLLDAPAGNRYVLMPSSIFPEVGAPGYDAFINAFFPIHEFGHTLNWPHTKSSTPGEYDTLSDVMSAGSGTSYNEGEVFTYAPAAGTAVYNLYRSGWIDQDEVEIVPAGGGTYTIEPQNGPDGATRMLVIRESPDSFYVLGAQPGGIHDRAERLWEGVEVYRVFPDTDNTIYPNQQDIAPLGDEPTWGPLIGPTSWDFLPHVIAPSHAAHVGEYTVAVTRRVGDAFTIEITPGNGPLPTFEFDDTSDSQFEKSVEFLASASVTKGCNPPLNSKFCPDQPVTRGQMASFLVRALGLEPGDLNRFSDVTSTNPHRNDIGALATAGITLGCNPPANTSFCPDQAVTRGQMASFLVRALDMDPVPYQMFVDTTSSPHRVDIEVMRAWQITSGCNPPDNNEYCPTQAVTRGQMAAFLDRAWWKIGPRR